MVKHTNLNNINTSKKQTLLSKEKLQEISNKIHKIVTVLVWLTAIHTKK
jgi:hypothetical protein